MSKEYYLENRRRLTRSLMSKKVPANSLVFLKGNVYYPEFDSDTNYDPLLCDPNFRYLIGPEYRELSACFHLLSDNLYFIVPKPDPDTAFFSYAMTQEEAVGTWGAKGVIYEEELEKFINEIKPEKILLSSGIDSNSGHATPTYENPELAKFATIVDKAILFPALNDLRTIKSEQDIEFLRKACAMTCLGHKQAMKNVKVGMREYNLAALFFSQALEMDSWAYPPICGSGPNAAYLHYELNTDEIKDGHLILCDMGAKYKGLCADITCTFPANGKFSKWQELVYNVVLKAQVNAVAKLRPFADYGEIQTGSYKDLLQGLVDIGLMKGDINEMFAKNIHRTWMPHGLGHFIGYKTHDVGPRKNDTDSSYFRLPEIKLNRGMCVTVEPGIYFIDILLDQAKKDSNISNFFVFDKIEEAKKEVGGVRIEDTLAITENGYDNLTHVPRTVKEIEAWMAS